MKRVGKTNGTKKYTFRFSCHHPTVGNEHTSDQVTVNFYGTNAQIFETKVLDGVDSCGDPKSIVAEGPDLMFVTMQTDGGDALLINWAQLETYTWSGGRSGHWGGLTTVKYGSEGPAFNCLSKDQDDYKSSKHRNDRCCRLAIFYPDKKGFYYYKDLFGEGTC